MIAPSNGQLPISLRFGDYQLVIEDGTPKLRPIEQEVEEEAESDEGTEADLWLTQSAVTRALWIGAGLVGLVGVLSMMRGKR